MGYPEVSFFSFFLNGGKGLNSKERQWWLFEVKTWQSLIYYKNELTKVSRKIF